MRRSPGADGLDAFRRGEKWWILALKIIAENISNDRILRHFAPSTLVAKVLKGDII